MNIDLAISQAMKRGPMESAMHSVVSNYGQSFELHATPQTIKRAEEMFGKSVGFAAPNPMARAAVPWASGVSFVTTSTPTPKPFKAEGAWDSPQLTPFNSPTSQKVQVPNLLNFNFETGRYGFNSYL